MAEARKDQNSVSSLLGASDLDGKTPVVIWADPTTHELFTRLDSVTTGGRLDVNDWNIEVARGNVTGVLPVRVVATNPAVGSTFEDIWDPGGTFTFPTAGETWEIVSSSTDDAAAGTGVRTVAVSSLDTDYAIQTTVVTLNGTIPVTLAGTHFRTRFAIAATAGSGGTNAGTITVRVSGGGATRYQMRVGEGTAFNGIYTVPAGTIAIPTSLEVFIPKNEDVSIKSSLTPSTADAATINGGLISIYQSPISIPVTSKVPIAEKTDFKLIAKSTNAAVSVTAVFQVLEDTSTGGVVPVGCEMMVF